MSGAAFGDPAGADLATVMKGMKAKFSDITRQMMDPTRNENSAILSLDLSVLILQAMQIVPPKLTKLPVAERDALYIDYRKLLSQLYVLSLDLEKAFRDGRNADVKAILMQMDALRKQGHALYVQEERQG